LVIFEVDRLRVFGSHGAAPNMAVRYLAAFGVSWNKQGKKTSHREWILSPKGKLVQNNNQFALKFTGDLDNETRPIRIVGSHISGDCDHAQVYPSFRPLGGPRAI
jgi:hypothetical protein